MYDLTNYNFGIHLIWLKFTEIGENSRFRTLKMSVRDSRARFTKDHISFDFSPRFVL